MLLRIRKAHSFAPLAVGGAYKQSCSVGDGAEWKSEGFMK